MAQTEIEGAKKLSQQLQKLGAAASGKILSQSASYAMTPVVNAARQSAPRGSKAHKTYKGRLVAPGFLARNIKKKTRRWKGGHGVTVSVGPHREAFYGTAFVELGTKNAPAKEWLEPAFDARKEQVISRLTGRLRQKIKAAAR